MDKRTIHALKAILTELSQNPNSEVFRKPVDWEGTVKGFVSVGLGLEDYPAIIKNPMDLSTVAKKLGKKKYTHLEECLNDL